MFVDNIMLFGHGSLREINFLKALWIVITKLREWELIWINLPCSLMVLEEELERQIAPTFPINYGPIDKE